MNTFLVIYLVGIPIVFSCLMAITLQSEKVSLKDWLANFFGAIGWPVFLCYLVLFA